MIATFLLLDYGDAFGAPMGTPRYQAALAVIGLAAVALVGIVAVLAWQLWREERILTETFVTIGLAGIPVAWLMVAACVLDLKTDVPSCGGEAVDGVFLSMAWAMG